MNEKSLIDFEDGSPSFSNEGAVVVRDREENDCRQLRFDVHSESNREWTESEFVAFDVDDGEIADIVQIRSRRRGESGNSSERNDEEVENFRHFESSSQRGALIESTNRLLYHVVVREV